MTIKEFFSFKTNKYFWVNIITMVVVVVVVLFGILKSLDSYTRHGEAVVVPDVKGMSMEEASNLFNKYGLTFVVADSSYSKNKEAGVILEMTPAAGQKVKEGRTVYLTINTLDAPLRSVPDVADNSSVRQAQAKIMAAGFKLNAMQTVGGEKDWVYGVKYQGRQLKAGDKVPLGASLTLIVGSGTEDILLNDSLDASDGATGSDKVEPSESSTTAHDDSWF